MGSHVVEKLLEAYPKSGIAVMARNPTVNIFPGVRYLKGDITKASDIESVFITTHPTIVFHCAGAMNLARGSVSDAVMRSINVDGTRLLLEASKRFAVKAFVFTSSASVAQKLGFRDLKVRILSLSTFAVHLPTRDQNCDETAPTVDDEDDVRIYSRTKSASERLVLQADDPTTGLRTVSLRPAVIYGERDNDFIPTQMAIFRRNGPVQIGVGTNEFSFTYAGNAADAHLLAAVRLLEPDPTGVSGEAFFVTNGDPVPFWEFVRAIQRAAGSTIKPDQVRVINTRNALILAWLGGWFAWFTNTKPSVTPAMIRYATMHRWYNIAKAKERLEYEPRVHWEIGVQRSVKVSVRPTSPICLYAVLLIWRSGSWRMKARVVLLRGVCAYQVASTTDICVPGRDGVHILQ
jgi:sterol-4alpha-carboxylate 3-dehydrogenase (decarboxylating)